MDMGGARFTLSVINPRKKQRDYVWACSKCGKVILLASGYVALAMDRQKAFDLMVRAGWSVAPRILCQKCQSKTTT
jgi:hypothetical protein